MSYQTTPQIPIADKELWTPADIAAFLQLSRMHVYNNILPLPGFPHPIMLPSTKITTGARRRYLYKQAEIRAWVNALQQGAA